MLKPAPSLRPRGFLETAGGTRGTNRTPARDPFEIPEVIRDYGCGFQASLHMAEAECAHGVHRRVHPHPNLLLDSRGATALARRGPPLLVPKGIGPCFPHRPPPKLARDQVVLAFCEAVCTTIVDVIARREQTSRRVAFSTKVALNGIMRPMGQVISELFSRAHRQNMLPGDDKVQVVRDISYQHGDQRRGIDFYLPRNRKAGARLPLVIFVHGGGWVMCSRRMSAAVGRILTARSISLAAPGYRLLPTCTPEEQLADVMQALRTIQGFGAARFGLDVQHMVLSGESAGANLIMRAAQQYPDDLVKPRGIVGIYGVYDVRRAWREKPTAYRPLADAFSQGGHTARALTAGSALRPLPWKDVPVLLMHGDQDLISPVSQSYALTEVLRSQGVQVDLRVYPNEGHGFIYKPGPGKRPPSKGAAQHAESNAARPPNHARMAYRTLFRFLFETGTLQRRQPRDEDLQQAA